MPPMDVTPDEKESQQTVSRKAEHVEIVLNEKSRADRNWWDGVSLIHDALPEFDLAEVDLSCEIFGRKLKAPLVISSMTGGYPDAEKINRNLAEAAARVGVGLGVGSQRAGLLKPDVANTFSVVKAFDVPLVMANIGAPQLIAQHTSTSLTIEHARQAMAMVDADVLLIHLNYLQEVVQPEGDTKARGVTLKIAEFARELPVVAKETGAGISHKVALALKAAGVKGIDVGGVGGTSFSAVEYYRAEREKDTVRANLGETFWNWGIPTPISVLEADVGLPVIATGGLRNGLDAAKAVALGASAAGMASKMLKPATVSADAVEEALNVAVAEMKAAFFLTGCRTVADLQKSELVLSDELLAWAGRLEPHEDGD
ncbi:MAG TPA: type 2 isopentenyl-diphosphate Delta-isomerase [Candidatus Thermoplasmatota archaeon]|nr:type 2 isopentenyl-diphosphate Delta-isomerase [Candidatus Thermoplasmatota archaeon]